MNLNNVSFCDFPFNHWEMNNFLDKETLNAATKLCAEMGYALARKHTRDSNDDIKSFRDRAYTLLYDTVSEVRVAGRYAFRSQPDKIQGYRHRYLSRKTTLNSM